MISPEAAAMPADIAAVWPRFVRKRIAFSHGRVAASERIRGQPPSRLPSSTTMTSTGPRIAGIVASISAVSGCRLSTSLKTGITIDRNGVRAGAGTSARAMGGASGKGGVVSRTKRAEGRGSQSEAELACHSERERGTWAAGRCELELRGPRSPRSLATLGMTRCTNLVPPSFSCQLVLLLAASSSHRDLHLRAFAEEGADVVDAQVHVAFADLDDPLCVRRLEHQHRQKVGRFCLAYAE